MGKEMHENEKGQKAIIESEQSRTRRSKTNASHEKKKKETMGEKRSSSQYYNSKM